MPVEDTEEVWVPSLGQEDPLEKEMAAHASILTWETPWAEGPGGLQSVGSQELDMTEQQHILGDRIQAFALWEPSLNPLPEIYPKNWSD